jgi:N,N'-diacetyl-8-epilegionaminate cytidylyltransferase
VDILNPYVVGFIFARGGSKGVRRKNVRQLAGKPLLAYAIEMAQKSKFIDRVVVSTDDQEIADVARSYGADVPFIRPAELAGDDSPERLAWQHALKACQSQTPDRNIDVFVCIPTTSPLRVVEDIDHCIETLLHSDADIVITVKPAERSPYYNMVVINGEGDAQLVIPPKGGLHRRQDAPQVYDMTTVAYAARPEHVLQTNYIFDGKVKTVIVPAERSLDIDTELDLKFAELQLMSKVSQVSPKDET